MTVNRSVGQEVAERGTVTLVVSGRATIQFAAELKGRLVDAIHSAATVEVDVSGVTRVDASFFQLLCSAHRTALAGGKSLCLAASLPDDFICAATAIGYGQADGNCTAGCCIL